MSTHLARHRAEMEKQAYPAVKRFLQQHPEYAIDANQSGSQSATNYVIFGRRLLDHGGEQPVIFKYFCQNERKAREVYALRHFAETGIVPQLLVDYDKRLIVQSRIPGGWFSHPANPAFGSVEAQRMGYTLGQATAKLLSVPLSAQAAQTYESRFYDGQPLVEYLREILDASWMIHERVGCYQGAVFGNSLTYIGANLPYILNQKRLLYHQDAMNMHFLDGNFSGFFDLEMCRVGTEAMQIGSLWTIFVALGVWDAFAQGYVTISERELCEEDLAAGRAFAHFLVWRYISRYGRWRGEPLEPEMHTQEEEDAARYSRDIERNNTVRLNPSCHH
jgi:hypothetical protein